MFLLGKQEDSQKKKIGKGVSSLELQNNSFIEDGFLPHMEQREMLCTGQGDPSFLIRIGSGPPFVLEKCPWHGTGLQIKTSNSAFVVTGALRLDLSGPR